MAMMAMLAPPSLNLDITKCMKMALFHDLAESLVGDITPADKVPKAEKNRRETIVMKHLTTTLLGRVSDGKAGEGILAIWQEFEESKTPESKFAQDIDKVEMLLQMVEYEKRGKGRINLKEFTYVVGKLHLSETKLWADTIIKERDDFWKDKDATMEDVVSIQAKELQDQYYGS
jgi:putative hydrolase of HD superfamily